MKEVESEEQEIDFDNDPEWSAEPMPDFEDPWRGDGPCNDHGDNPDFFEAIREIARDPNEESMEAEDIRMSQPDEPDENPEISFQDPDRVMCSLLDNELPEIFEIPTVNNPDAYVECKHCKGLLQTR